MKNRAAICIGVDRAGTMTALSAAAKGAQKFREWAERQGCDTQILNDESGNRVTLTDIFDAVSAVVDKRTYQQLIIYFSGHGVLSAPGVEYWLLSRAPGNPNEAVNLFRSIEDARNSGIPNVVIVSDACRSCVNGPPLSGVSGGTIFPNLPYGGPRSEVDVFYATRPGDPAWEVPENEATKEYSGVFTSSLLDTVTRPLSVLIERLQGPPPLSVVTARKLKPHLEALVPREAGRIDIRLRQMPELRVESALPTFFAAVPDATVQPVPDATVQPRSGDGGPGPEPQTMETALRSMAGDKFLHAIPNPSELEKKLARDSGLEGEVERLIGLKARERFESHTGFTIHGAEPISTSAPGWKVDDPFAEGDGQGLHLRFNNSSSSGGSAVVRFRVSGGGTAAVPLAVIPEYIGSVVIDETARVTSVSYVPSANSPFFQDYEQRASEIDRMRAVAAVAARHGRFEVPRDAEEFADYIRLGKQHDPVLGIYAAYAYLQEGRYDEIESVFHYMSRGEAPIPFDVVMLTWRNGAPKGWTSPPPQSRITPFCPMLSQGWALFGNSEPLHQQIHEDLRPHLIPALWTTLTDEGADIAERYIRSGGQS